MPGKLDPKSAQLASVTRELVDGRTTVVFSRTFALTRETLWELLTDPARLALWAPHTADRDLGAVGRVVFTMIGDDSDAPGSMPNMDVSGAVLEAAAPEILEHTWAGDVLLWRLHRDEEGAKLTLRHTLADPTMASAVAAGWHLCLEVADAVGSGRPTVAVRGREAMNHGWADLNERYASELGLAPSRTDLD